MADFVTFAASLLIYVQVGAFLQRKSRPAQTYLEQFWAQFHTMVVSEGVIFLILEYKSSR